MSCYCCCSINIGKVYLIQKTQQVENAVLIYKKISCEIECFFFILLHNVDTLIFSLFLTDSLILFLFRLFFGVFNKKLSHFCILFYRGSNLYFLLFYLRTITIFHVSFNFQIFLFKKVLFYSKALVRLCNIYFYNMSVCSFYHSVNPSK